MIDRKRPTAIHIEGCDNVTLNDNIGVGDMDLISAKNSSNIKGSGNKLINEPSGFSEPSKLKDSETPSDKSFFMNHLLSFSIALLVAIIAIFLLQPFQQELQHSKQQTTKEAVPTE